MTEIITPQLPNNWEWCKLDDISRRITQGPNPKYDLNVDPSFRVLKTKDFYDDRILYEKTDQISSKVFSDFDGYKLIDDDILIGLVGVGSTGKCNIFKSQNNVEYILTRATGLVRLINKDLTLPKYLHYFLISNHGKKVLESITGGSTGQLVIRTSLLKAVLIPLAPVNEQKRIVSEVEELFSFLDAGTESLHKIQAQLKRYRQAVLESAFEGKLTEEWRKNHSSLIKSTSHVKNSYSLPSEWIVKPLSEIAEIQMGQSPPGSSYGNRCQGIPLLNGPTEFGVNHPNPRQWTNKPTQVCKNGDLLICVRGNTTGRMNWADQKYCIGRGLASITPHEKISNRFFVYYFLLKEVNEIMRRTTGSTFPNLKSSELKNFELPLPPYDEQNVIVQMIEERFSIAHNTEKTVQIVLLQANSLRQSILKNAFEGKLVLQDPTDESAEKLLDQIKSERISNKKYKTNAQLELSNYVK